LFNNTNSTYSHANNPLANTRPNSTSTNLNFPTNTNSRPNTNNSTSRPSTSNSTDNSRPSTTTTTNNNNNNNNNNSRPNTNNNRRRNTRKKAIVPDVPDAIVHIDPFEVHIYYSYIIVLSK